MKFLTVEFFDIFAVTEVYLCNRVPPFKDEYFSSRSYHLARSKLDHLDYKNLTLTGDICLQLGGTLWLNNVVQMTSLTDGREIVKFSLNSLLHKLKVVDYDAAQSLRLFKLCRKYHVTVPSTVKRTNLAETQTKTAGVQGQTAFLDCGVNEVYLSCAHSPGEFYVRLAKFQTL